MTQIPQWGRVVAQPHEYLIQIRGGRVRRAGQGLACFKWPSDSVAVIPTSIAKLSFKADQVTLEKTGVEVTGLAVYRIADPMIAHRMVDLDRASLTEILRDMFIGATRRIVSGLTLDECITHRKDRVAAALMREIAPVLAGEGALADSTAQGWGIILDTIEIQDVRVLSQEVFARLQAPYREALALEALVAHDKVVREQAKLETDRRRTAEQAQRALMDEEEARLAAVRKRQAEAQKHQDALSAAAEEAELVRLHHRAEKERERKAIDLLAKREAGELDAELTRMARVAHEDLSEARLREIMITETMPTLANAFRGTFDRVNVTSTSGDLLGFLTAGLDQVMDLARTRQKG